MAREIHRALIVEDSRLTRDLIELAIGHSAKTEIVEAEDGAQAIAALQSGGVDVIIMDWKMDAMDGLECTRRIRAGIDGVNPKTPILLLTGADGSESEDEAYAAGVDLFMKKPFSLKQLHFGLNKVLSADQANVTGSS